MLPSDQFLTVLCAYESPRLLVNTHVRILRVKFRAGSIETLKLLDEEHRPTAANFLVATFYAIFVDTQEIILPFQLIMVLLLCFYVKILDDSLCHVTELQR